MLLLSLGWCPPLHHLSWLPTYVCLLGVVGGSGWGTEGRGGSEFIGVTDLFYILLMVRVMPTYMSVKIHRTLHQKGEKVNFTA